MFNFFKKHNPTCYTLPCGQKADMLKCYRELLLSGVNSLIDNLKDPEVRVWAKAEEQLVVIIRRVFKLKDFDSVGGYSDEDVLNVFNDFMSNIEKKDKKAQSLVTTVPATDVPATPQMSNNCGC